MSKHNDIKNKVEKTNTKKKNLDKDHYNLSDSSFNEKKMVLFVFPPCLI